MVCGRNAEKKQLNDSSWPGYRTVWFVNEKTRGERWSFEITAFVGEFFGWVSVSGQRCVYVLLLSCMECVCQY